MYSDFDSFMTILGNDNDLDCDRCFETWATCTCWYITLDLEAMCGTVLSGDKYQITWDSIDASKYGP